jgi:hypothetical protein
MTEDMGRVDSRFTSSETRKPGPHPAPDGLLRTARQLLTFGPRNCRRFDFTGRVDRQDAFFGRPVTIIRIRSDPSKISETIPCSTLLESFVSDVVGAAAQWDGPFPEAARDRDGDGLRRCQGI